MYKVDMSKNITLKFEEHRGRFFVWEHRITTIILV